jgi:DNA-binding beta-propeller fold protein YncE
VVKFDTNGLYLAQWGSAGTGNGQFSSPVGIAIDTANNVYVADQSNPARVQKFNNSGTYVTQFSGTPSSPFGTFYALSIATDTGNNVYVISYAFGGSVATGAWKLTSTGADVTSYNFASYSAIGWSLALDDNNNLYAFTYNNQVLVLANSGTLLTQWSSGANPGPFSTAAPLQIVAVDKSNNVYVADGGNYQIQKFSTNGTSLTQVGEPRRQRRPVLRHSRCRGGSQRQLCVCRRRR